jgi:hypothetical protein
LKNNKILISNEKSFNFKFITIIQIISSMIKYKLNQNCCIITFNV